MIWPQQYHKEKQGSRWPEEGSIDVTLRPSQPVEAPGEQPLYVQSAEIDLGPESPLLLEVPAPQPEAPAAVTTSPSAVIGAKAMSPTQQRVLDVNPESPTDATRGDGEQKQDRFSLEISPSAMGQHAVTLIDTTTNYATWMGTVSDAEVAFLNSLAPRGVGEDPIPQRECEHEWRVIGYDRPLSTGVVHSVFWCTDCGATQALGDVLLPRPIDPRSEAR